MRLERAPLNPREVSEHGGVEHVVRRVGAPEMCSDAAECGATAGGEIVWGAGAVRDARTLDASGDIPDDGDE